MHVKTICLDPLAAHVISSLFQRAELRLDDLGRAHAAMVYGKPAKVYGKSAKVYGKSAKMRRKSTGTVRKK